MNAINKTEKPKKPIVIHWSWGASGIQLYLEDWHELVDIFPLDEHAKPYKRSNWSILILKRIAIIKDWIQELISPSDYVMWKHKK